MNLNSYKNRSKFIKRLIFWLILVGGILTLIFSYSTAVSLEIGSLLSFNIDVNADHITNQEHTTTKDVCKEIGGCLSGVGDNKGGTQGIVDFVIGLARNLVFILVAVAVAAIVWGAFMMVTSNGEEEKYMQGLTTLKYVVTGLVLGIVSFTIIYLLTTIVTNLEIF